MISRSSPVAPWRQLHDLLREQITSGKLKPGDRLPSIIALSQEYDVAHTTARKALVALQEEGLVASSPMGTFVADSKTPRKP